MKTVQVQFNDQDYQGMKELSQVTSDSVEEILAKGVALYRLLKFYEQEGRHLAVMDDDWKVYAQLNIKGITERENAPLPLQPVAEERPAAQ